MFVRKENLNSKRVLAEDIELKKVGISLLAQNAA
jgi:hypothetical protein